MKKYIEFISENLNYARSVLRKVGIDESDPNFVKLRDMCKDKPGYLGILTKLVFIDKAPMDEIQDIYNGLVEFNINVGDVIKMSYIEVSDLLMNKSIEGGSEDGFKFEFSDGIHNYFRVYSYEGILNIGSPAWCLKTKKHWDDYLSSDPIKNQQWVIIEKGSKKLITPHTNYFKKYVNQSNPNIRVGLTINRGKKEHECFDDNNNKIEPNKTIRKLITQNIESYNKFGKFVPRVIDDYLNIKPIVSFGGNKKIYKVDKLLNKIDDFFFIDSDSRPSDHQILYLYTINDNFKFYCEVKNGLCIKEYDIEYSVRKLVNINDSFYFELVKFLHGEKKYIPNVLVPHAYKLGILKDEDLNKDNRILYEFKGAKKYAECWTGTNGNNVIELVDMNLLDGYDNLSYFIIFLGPRISSKISDYNDVHKRLRVSDGSEYTLHDENLNIISKCFGIGAEMCLNKLKSKFEKEREEMEKERRKREEMEKIEKERRDIDRARREKIENEKRQKEMKERMEREEKDRKEKEERIRIERSKKPWNKFKKWVWGD